MALILISSIFGMKAVNVGFTGESHKIIDVIPERSTGLDHVYVVYDMLSVSEMRISEVGSNVTVSRYSSLGGGYAEPVATHWDGNDLIVDRPEGDMGYIISDGGDNHYIWVVNYAPHRFELSSVSSYPEQECSSTRLSVTGSGDAIHYYTIDGRPVELSRDIEVGYTSLAWDEDANDYSRQSMIKTYPHLSDPMTIVPALYCATEVTISGDRFLQEWGMGKSVSSPTLQPNGLEIHTTAVQTNRSEDPEEGSNVINSDTSGLGGSAPAVILFSAYVTDAVIHNEWQLSQDPQFEDVDYRFNEKEVEYTFEEEGVFYMRYIGSNADGSCEEYSETYTISIGASDLRIPNAFSPNDDGVNDVWKVGYRSLLSFKCWIFDRYGNQIHYFDDPNSGWDGKYRGKTVKSGVYYYVIEATGSDGKKYKKGGDINIVSYKRNGTSTVQP